MNRERSELALTPEEVYQQETSQLRQVCDASSMHLLMDTAPGGGVVKTQQDSDIVRFYKGQSVFLTGATGFFGKIAIEKLLRCCPDIDNIFILCRDKKGKNVHERIEDIFNDVLFARVNRLYPKCRHKVTPIKGDIAVPNLGISIEDRQLLTSKVNVMIHAAATVRFDEKLRTAMRINVSGTKEMLKLAKECAQLKSFVYVSTAFSHCERTFIDEKFYPMPVNLAEFEAMVDRKSDDELRADNVISPWPNTYAFTKAMAELVVEKEAGDLPLCVFRPSIVISTYQEPIRGWIDNVYGPTGVITGAGLGILRTLYCDAKNVAEIVPVDFVLNALIASSLKASRRTPGKEITIYNYVSSVENPITWGQFCEWNSFYGIKIPSIRAFWYYSFTLNKYKAIHLFYTIFLQWLPAFLIDGLCLVVGKQPQLVTVYRKIEKFSQVISYFSIRRWYFKNNNVQDLWLDTSDEDQSLFPFDIKLINWQYHSQMNIFGVRTYIIKEDPTTLPIARKKWKRLYVLHNIVKYAFYLILLRIVYTFFAIFFV